MQSWKRSKTSWMGHGAWMGITWGTWKMGEWGRSIAPKMLHVSGGYVSRAQATGASKCVLGRSSKLDMFWWVVSFKVLVLRLMFLGVRFSTSENECQATTKTQQVSMSVCSEAPLPVRGNPCAVTLKRATHLRLVAEMMWGPQIQPLFHQCPPSWAVSQNSDPFLLNSFLQNLTNLRNPMKSKKFLAKKNSKSFEICNFCELMQNFVKTG